VKEISDFILKKESETPKDVVDSLLALKEHILCVHFMMKMHKNMENDKVKSKMNEEERNAFWTIVDKEKYVILDGRISIISDLIFFCSEKWNIKILETIP
jgi:hypothetical protein